VGKKTIVIKSSMRVPRWELIFDANVFTLLSNHTIFLKHAAPPFATGLGGLGLLGWRRKRKAAALAA
jgi:hypothetical protein